MKLFNIFGKAKRLLEIRKRSLAAKIEAKKDMDYFYGLVAIFNASHVKLPK